MFKGVQGESVPLTSLPVQSLLAHRENGQVGKCCLGNRRQGGKIRDEQCNCTIFVIVVGICVNILAIDHQCHHWSFGNDSNVIDLPRFRNSVIRCIPLNLSTLRMAGGI